MTYIDKLYDYLTSDEILKIYDGLADETIKIYDGLSISDACLNETLQLLQLTLNSVGINGFIELGYEDANYPFVTYTIYSYERVNKYLSKYFVKMSLYTVDMEEAITKCQLMESGFETIECVQKVAQSGVFSDGDHYRIDVFYRFHCDNLNN